MTRPTHGDFGDFPTRLALKDAANSSPMFPEVSPALQVPEVPELRAGGFHRRAHL
jgi:hypothetical protein